MPKAHGLLSDEWREQLLSLEQNGNAPFLTQGSLAQIEEAYGAPADDLRISYLLNEDHGRLPTRAYFQICGLDLLRDETFLWEKLLAKHSGTQSKIDLYSGLPHGFWRFLHSKASSDWLDDLIEGFRLLLLANEGSRVAEEAKLNVKGL
ncbi:hypothetical protein N7509_002061 [Penicillium cosmopolitanum]|uniref:Alpha/beta hydrolase fold-3 domain-containing protein n=1 Tax=Penicillium cosmopolitanum TaxID=1131564 RepID=A0A9X0BCZ8_9EURO|nr:uncharacterized protein N7509_002061 [Penicillium cosmopolitanum]KAJ5408178.1 hypothetical protein N7509_002061 [Penicillium cosmopolitanum]